MDAQDVKHLAQFEVDQENFRKAVEKEKFRIRLNQGVPSWRKLFPWSIRFVHFNVENEIEIVKRDNKILLEQVLKTEMVNKDLQQQISRYQNLQRRMDYQNGGHQ